MRGVAVVLSGRINPVITDCIFSKYSGPVLLSLLALFLMSSC